MGASHWGQGGARAIPLLGAMPSSYPGGKRTVRRGRAAPWRGSLCLAGDSGGLGVEGRCFHPDASSLPYPARRGPSRRSLPPALPSLPPSLLRARPSRRLRGRVWLWCNFPFRSVVSAPVSAGSCPHPGRPHRPGCPHCSGPPLGPFCFHPAPRSRFFRGAAGSPGICISPSNLPLAARRVGEPYASPARTGLPPR